MSTINWDTSYIMSTAPRSHLQFQRLDTEDNRWMIDSCLTLQEIVMALIVTPVCVTPSTGNNTRSASAGIATRSEPVNHLECTGTFETDRQNPWMNLHTTADSQTRGQTKTGVSVHVRKHSFSHHVSFTRCVWETPDSRFASLTAGIFATPLNVVLVHAVCSGAGYNVKQFQEPPPTTPFLKKGSITINLSFFFFFSFSFHRCFFYPRAELRKLNSQVSCSQDATKETQSEIPTGELRYLDEQPKKMQHSL